MKPKLLNRRTLHLPSTPSISPGRPTNGSPPDQITFSILRRGHSGRASFFRGDERSRAPGRGGKVAGVGERSPREHKRRRLAGKGVASRRQQRARPRASLPGGFRPRRKYHPAAIQTRNRLDRSPSSPRGEEERAKRPHDRSGGRTVPDRGLRSAAAAAAAAPPAGSKTPSGSLRRRQWLEIFTRPAESRTRGMRILCWISTPFRCRRL